MTLSHLVSLRMSDSALILLNGITKGLRDSVVGMFRVYNMDKGQADGSEDGETLPAEEAPTVLARRRAARQKMTSPGTSGKDSPPKVCQRILLCCAWNGGLFWLSLLIFNGIVIPSLQYLTHAIFGSTEGMSNMIWSYMGPMLTATFGALWVLPLFLLSKVVNSFWFQDIADSAYRKSRGRPQLPGLGKVIADVLFSVLLQSLFLIQAMLATMLPIQGVGDFLSLLHLCLLYSLYAFEYKWFNMGWEVHKRLSYIECNWPYFIGFGLPLAILTSLPKSFIVSGCVFSILFPLFIVSANEAEPIQRPYDFPLRLFGIVVALSNVIFQRGLKKSGNTASAGSVASRPGSTATASSGSTTASPRHVKLK